MKNCIACSSADVFVAATIPVKTILGFYQKELKLDVAKFFSGVNEIHLIECKRCELQFYDPPIAGDESLYESLAQFDWYYQSEKPEFSVAAKYVKPGSKVLEIGAGRGAFKSYLEGSEYVGLELNPEGVKQASQRGIHLINETLESFSPNHLSQYDVVCSFQVLEHVPNPKNFIQSALDCLKPGGLLLFSVPNRNSFYGKVSNSFLDMPPHHLSRWNEKTFQMVAKDSHSRFIDAVPEKMQASHMRMFSKEVLRDMIRDKREVLDSRRAHNFVLNGISKVIAPFFSAGVKTNLIQPKGLAVVGILQKQGEMNPAI